MTSSPPANTKAGIFVPPDYWKIVLPEPIRVSPLIRFCRWTALLGGIAWGAYRYRKNCQWHAEVREMRYEEQFKEKLEEHHNNKIVATEQYRQIFKEVGLDETEGIAAFGVYDAFRPV